VSEYFKPIQATVREQLEWARQDHPRIATGFSIMDSRTSGGGAQGELVLFQARSGVGKTTFALNVINNVAYGLKIPTVFFSLEMHGRYIAQRLAAIHFDTPTSEIEADLGQGYSRHLSGLVSDFETLTIIDNPNMSFKSMGEAIRETELEWDQKVQFVVVDYAEYITGVRAMGSMEQVDMVMKQAKKFAREHDVLLLLLHQVSRGAGEEGHLPLTATSGRFGGEQSADYILSGYRTHLEPGIPMETMEVRQKLFHLQFLKTRGGHSTHPMGMAHNYDPESMRITEKVSRQMTFGEGPRPGEEPF